MATINLLLILLEIWEKSLLKHYVSKKSQLSKQQWNIFKLPQSFKQCLYGINGTFMSYLGVLIVNNIPCWDFPSLIKGCLIKVYSLKGQIDCLSECHFSLDFSNIAEITSLLSVILNWNSKLDIYRLQSSKLVQSPLVPAICNTAAMQKLVT